MTPYYSDSLVTIYHGDCREIAAGLARESMDLLLTDPPYGIGYVSNMAPVPSRPIVGDEAFDASWLPHIARLIRPAAAAYVFAQDASIGPMRDALVATGWRLSRMLVWDKQAMTPGDLTDFGSRTEFIAAANAAGDSLKRRNGPRGSNLLSVPRVDTRVRTHPAEKPVALLSYLVIRATNPGELVLDPFMGTGASLVAAKSLNRHAIGIEIEERYCEIAAQRCSQEVLGLAV